MEDGEWRDKRDGKNTVVGVPIWSSEDQRRNPGCRSIMVSSLTMVKPRQRVITNFFSLSASSLSIIYGLNLSRRGSCKLPVVNKSYIACSMDTCYWDLLLLLRILVPTVMNCGQRYGEFYIICYNARSTWQASTYKLIVSCVTIYAHI